MLSAEDSVHMGEVLPGHAGGRAAEYLLSMRLIWPPAREASRALCFRPWSRWAGAGWCLGRGGRVSADVLVALAQFAGQTVAAAAITDAWEAARVRFARLLGRGDAHKAEVAERWLSQTREQLAAATPGTDLEWARDAQAERWAGRFADLLDEDPGLEAELRCLVEEVAAQLPAGAVAASSHSVAAGRDVAITATGGGVAAGVLHGNVALPGPTSPGPAKP
jgi:hypothetical protein